MTWREALRRSPGLTGRQWHAAWLTLWYLPAVNVSLRGSGLMPTLRRFMPARAQCEPQPGLKGLPGDAVSLGRVVERVCSLMPWQVDCLPLSVTQWIVLGRLGIEADLRIGVGSQEHDLAAHAWVQVGETSLGSRMHEGGYARIWSCRNDGLDFPPC